MDATKALQAGDRCPISGGEFVLDMTQHPDVLIERHTKSAASPAVAARYAEQVRAKVDEHGLLHVCPQSGYRARFPATRQSR